MIANEIRARAKSELVVAILEEWGYRMFIWLPGMTDVELENWWLALDDVESFWKTEPGTKVRLREGWPGEFIDAEEPDNLYKLWCELWDTAPYASHIDMNSQRDLSDPDTYLKRRTDGRLFVHKGATGERHET